MQSTPQVGERHLACLVAIAEEGSLSRAAQRLHLSQPAVSKTLAELERIAGSRLVERGRSGARLTRDGEHLLGYAEDVTRALRTAASVLAGASSSPVALLRIAALPTVAGGLLPPAVAELWRRHPRAVIQIQTGSNAEVLAALKSGEADIAIGRMAEPAAMHGIAFELLYAESLCVVTRPGHPAHSDAAGGAGLDLGTYPLIVPERGTAPRHHVDAFLDRHGVGDRGGLVETQESSVARAIALVSDSLWITPRHVTRLDLDHGWLTELAVTVPAPAEPIGVLTRAREKPEGLARAIIDLLHRPGG